jgi:hypothetical protein
MNWKDEITGRMSLNKDSWENVESCTLSEERLAREFDADYGGTEGDEFTIWTTHYIYFPVCYDGAEWADSISRNPDGNATGHIGGG